MVVDKSITGFCYHNFRILNITLYLTSILSLSENDRRVIEQLVADEINILRTARPDPRRFRQIWRYEHENDFLYGYIVGLIEGAVATMFMQRENRRLSLEEQFQIREIIEVHSREIRSLIFGN